MHDRDTRQGNPPHRRREDLRRACQGSGREGRRVERIVAAAALAVALWGALPAAAQLGVDVHAGSLGVGGGLSWDLAPELAVRIEGDGFPTVSRMEKAGDNRYDAHLGLASAGGLLDWHPTGGGFRVTAGALYDANQLDGDSVPNAGGYYVIGPVELPASVVGSLHASVAFPSVAPYLGIGWGPPPRTSRGFGFYADLGVAYMGRPQVTLTPEPPPGSPLDNPFALGLLAPAIAVEEGRIESKIEGYRYLPVLALGVAYRF